MSSPNSMLRLLLCVLFLGMSWSQTIDEVDITGVTDVHLSREEGLVSVVLSRADGSESSIAIDSLNIHSEMSRICSRVPFADCKGTMDTIALQYYGIYYTPSLPHATLEDYNGTRVDIIRHIAENFPVSEYLEIGTAKNDAFDKATELFAHAVGVDPNEGGTLRMTSDEFFATNTATFDVIYVDGLHEANQAFRDVHNALEILNPGGFVLVHDCNPRSFFIQDKAPLYEGGLWSGDAWKAAVALRLRQDIEIVMVDVDYGVGVIRKRPNRHPLPAEWIEYLDVNPISMLTYEMHDEFGHTLQRFMTLNDVREWLAEKTEE